MEMMKQLRNISFFDCNCCVGYWNIQTFEIAKNSKELVKEMNFNGINKALIYHSEMRFSSPLTGNDALLKEIRNEKNLKPLKCVLPPQTNEMKEMENIFEDIKKNNIKAFILFPNEHQYMIDKETFGEFFKECQLRNVPLFIKDNLVSIRNLLRSYPKLNIIAMFQGPHILDRYFRPLIENYPNFYIETSLYLAANGIENFCKKYGADRLLFGTGYPGNYMGSAMLRLLHANISEKYKRKIASENLENLLLGANL